MPTGKPVRPGATPFTCACGTRGAESFYSYNRTLCKACVKDREHKRYRAKRAEIAAYDRNRNATAKRRKSQVERSLRHNAVHPERKKARQAVNHAIQAGRLERQPCEVCGNPKAQGHHDDYSKPLQVRWLCHVHHREVHGQEVRL